jgi:chromate transporter
LPQVGPFIYGIKPAIIAVVVAMMVSVGRRALKSVELGIIGAIALILTLYGVNEMYVLFGAGLLGVLIHLVKQQRQTMNNMLPFVWLRANTGMPQLLHWKLFWIFLKIGSVLYGSGYVLFAFLDDEFVQKGMLTRKELIDAVAVGQFTPGPVFSSATFIGWQMAGLPGGIAATVGIFLPSFLFVAFLNPLVKRLRNSKSAAAFLDTVNIVSVAMILAICIEMDKDSVTDWKTIAIALAGFAVTMTFKKLNTAFVILGGAAAGYLLSFV